MRQYAGLKHRAFSHAARAVQHGQGLALQIRRDDTNLAVPSEEKLLVGFPEGPQSYIWTRYGFVRHGSKPQLGTHGYHEFLQGEVENIHVPAFPQFALECRWLVQNSPGRNLGHAHVFEEYAHVPVPKAVAEKKERPFCEVLAKGSRYGVVHA